MDHSSIAKKLELIATNRYVGLLFDRQNFDKLGKFLAISAAAYIVTSRLYAGLCGPLSHVPGPFLFKFAGTPFMTFNKGPGTLFLRFQAWSAKYGPTVRLGPKYLSIADKDMLKQVIAKDDFPKGPAYDRIQRGTSETMFTSMRKEFHKRRRRIASPAFSVKYLNSLESYMTTTIESFIQRIDRDIEKTRSETNDFGTVDIWAIFQYLALDVIGKAAFGKSFHMLEQSEHFVPHTILEAARASYYHISNPYTGAVKLIFTYSKMFSAMIRLQKFMNEIILERIEGGDAARRQDVLQILIDSHSAKNSEDRLTAKAIAGETVMYLVAGSETTGNSLGFAMIRLLENPHVMDCLRAEIDAIPLEPGQKLFRHEQLKNLPYLTAVIQETLRMDPVAAGGIERVAQQDTVLAGRLFVPKGTIVHCNIYHAHMNPNYWPEPYKFKPERWLEGTNPPPPMDAYYPFSAGSRNCIGKAFAMQEMRLAMATLIRLYDFEAIPQALKDAQERRCYVIMTLAKDSLLVRMKRRPTVA